MTETTGYDRTVVLALSLSFTGLFLAMPLAIFMPATEEVLFWRKPLIGSLFSLICISGIFAASFPEKCSKFLYRHEKENLTTEKAGNSFNKLSMSFKGHHPVCERFSAHLLHLKGKTFCAACSGLLVGALLVLALAFLYFFAEWNFSEGWGFWSVLVGQIGAALGFSQFKLKGLARAALNLLFVVSCFLILMGADMLAKNVFVDLYLVGLTLFLLFTRIELSRWDHLRICSSCELACKLKMGRGG